MRRLSVISARCAASQSRAFRPNTTPAPRSKDSHRRESRQSLEFVFYLRAERTDAQSGFDGHLYSCRAMSYLSAHRTEENNRGCHAEKPQTRTPTQDWSPEDNPTQVGSA